MTTTSIGGSEFGKAGNCIYWEDVTDEEMDTMQKDYWELLTEKFDELCKEKGSTGCLMLHLSEVYYDVGDKNNIDFSEVLAEARREAYEDVLDRNKDRYNFDGSESGDYE